MSRDRAASRYRVYLASVGQVLDRRLGIHAVGLGFRQREESSYLTAHAPEQGSNNHSGCSGTA